jgi:hypothetical protein
MITGPNNGARLSTSGLGNTPEVERYEAGIALEPLGLHDSLPSLIADVSLGPERALQPFLAWCAERRYEIEAQAFVDGWRL